ncbi:MAG: NfeD family protein [Burkholderiaceae bacterium]|jgi:membrane protein implicated in regulation of membrane protease activity|nr:NfeD family protein [Burkholderiaceae bacterium]
MSAWIWWMVLAFGLLILELLSGTFYLLVIAAAMAAGGLANLAGAPFELQLVVAAAIGLAGSLWLRRSRFGRPADDPGALQSFDVGQVVRIDRWSDAGSARAAYRGAEWDVLLAPGETAAPGDYVIRSVQGSRLVVARKTD